MKITDIILEDIEFIESPQTLRQLLADVQQEMEQVDDASMGSKEGDAKHAGLSQDYSALLAVENVIKNHLKALKNNLMDSNIFMYDNYDYAGEIAAIHVALQGQVAHVKWLGSYNGQGGQLYRAATQEAKRRGATSVEVEAKWNSDGFYRKMGLDTTQQGEYNPFTDSQLNKMAGPLEEAFDRPYKTKWKKSNFAHPGSAYSEVQLPDGTPLIVVFYNQGDGKYNVEFSRNQSGGLTGRGDAQKIFATVLHDILEFVEERKPQQLAFTASKELDPNLEPGVRANPNSRAKLYTRMVQRYAEPLGYKVQYQEAPGLVLYTLTQITPEEDTLEEETLEELIGIKNQTRDLPRNPPRNAEYPLGLEWHKVLYNNGFKALGSGSFGTVWEHPKLSYVLKVFTSDDIAYADWIATAQQHKNNPHMPKFISPRIVRIVPGVVAIRMERLTRIDTATYNMLNMINIVVNEAIISRQSASALIASSIEYRRHNGFMTYCQNYPEFVPALDILVKFVMRPGFRPDLHDDNLMMRGPEIVLTDPVFDKKALLAHGR